MNLALKIKLFRIINFGAIDVDNFSDKKNIQIYNIFILMVFSNVGLYGLLLLLNNFVDLFYFTLGCLVILFFGLYLNYKNEVVLSKIIVIQFYILVIMTVISIFSYDTLFTLYYFLVILFCTIVFNEKETKQKLFFITQCFVLLFISLTHYKNYLININLLPENLIRNVNLINTIIFLVFLFIYIFFHTIYREYKEKKYDTINYRLHLSNVKIRKYNTTKRVLVSTTSNLLESYFNFYTTFYEQYIGELKNVSKNKEKIVNYYNQLNDLNFKIEEVLNYQFSNNQNTLLVNFSEYEITKLTQEILHENYREIYREIYINRAETINIKIHYDLYRFFLYEIMKYFKEKNNPKFIYISIEKKNVQEQMNLYNSDLFDALGIYVLYNIEENTILNIKLIFSENPNYTAIYQIL